jgi:hypothetical protein
MQSKFGILFLGAMLCAGTGATSADADEKEALPKKVFSLLENYLDAFQHADTGILYGARLSGKDNWTSPQDVRQEKPKPRGYGSRIADTALHTGHMLVALLGAHEARPDPYLRRQIARLFAALKLIGSLPETHPKPGRPDLEGLVPRGPHPNDQAAYYDDSSMDQHTTYIISLAVYANSSLATESEKTWIRESLDKVGRRLERHGWSIKRADGVTQAHVGFSWKGHNSSHASILLPAVAALYHGTGNRHWLEQYEDFLSEAEGKRWQMVHPGPHVRINSHPIYANQNAFRLHAWHRFEPDEERKQVIRGLLKQSVEMQLSRDFPGEFYRRFHDAKNWQELAARYGWQDTELRGATIAWAKFDPKLLEGERNGLAALAHIRFPLGGFHMALLSESRELIGENVPAIHKMLDSVNLAQIDAGETHYLFSVVALHLYANHFRSAESFPVEVSDDLPFGRSLPISGTAGIGPVMDAATSNDRVCAIGRGTLHVLGIKEPLKPRVLGRLKGLLVLDQ